MREKSQGVRRDGKGNDLESNFLILLHWFRSTPCDPLLKTKQNKIYDKTKCSLKCQPVLLARGGGGRGWGVGLSSPHPPQVSGWRPADISELVINFKISILLKLLKTVRKIS